MKKIIIFVIILIMLFNYQILSIDYGIITTNTSELNTTSLLHTLNTLTGINSIKYFPNPFSDNYFIVITHQANGYLFTATINDITTLKAFGNIAGQYYPIQIQTIHPFIYLLAFIVVLASPIKNNSSDITHQNNKTINIASDEQIKKAISPDKVKIAKKISKKILSLLIFAIGWIPFIISAGYYMYYTYYIYLRNNGYKDWFMKNSLEKQTTSLEYTTYTFLIAIIFTTIFLLIKKKTKNTKLK